MGWGAFARSIYIARGGCLFSASVFCGTHARLLKPSNLRVVCALKLLCLQDPYYGWRISRVVLCVVHASMSTYTPQVSSLCVCFFFHLDCFYSLHVFREAPRCFCGGQRGVLPAKDLYLVQKQCCFVVVLLLLQSGHGLSLTTFLSFFIFAIEEGAFVYDTVGTVVFLLNTLFGRRSTSMSPLPSISLAGSVS